MSYLSFVEYKGELWNYVFADPDIFGVSNEDREHLMWHVVDLLKDGKTVHNVKGEDYEGKVEKKKHACVGGIAGVLFEAELETSKGKRKPKIILMDKVNASLN